MTARANLRKTASKGIPPGTVRTASCARKAFPPGGNWCSVRVADLASASNRTADCFIHFLARAPCSRPGHNCTSPFRPRASNPPALRLPPCSPDPRLTAQLVGPARFGPHRLLGHETRERLKEEECHA